MTRATADRAEGWLVILLRAQSDHPEAVGELLASRLHADLLGFQEPACKLVGWHKRTSNLGRMTMTACCLARFFQDGAHLPFHDAHACIDYACAHMRMLGCEVTGRQAGRYQAAAAIAATARHLQYCGTCCSSIAMEQSMVRPMLQIFI